MSLLFLGLAGLAAGQRPNSVSKHDLRLAEGEFKKALDFQKNGKLEEALESAVTATQLVPGNVEYLATGEMLRQQLVGKRLEMGNRLAEKGDRIAAAEQFRAGLSLDPQNAYVAQRLHDVMPVEDPEKQHTFELLAAVDQINLAPAPGKKSFHLQGDTRTAYNQIGQAFGITMTFDQGMSSRVLRFDLDNVDFYTAMGMLGRMTKTFWSPVQSREAIVASDSQENRKQYERLSLRTFYVGNVTGQTDLNDFVNVMRTIFDLKFVSIQPAKNTITVRGPRQDVEAAASLIENLMVARPEIMIDVKEYEVDSDRLRQFGLNLPTDFQVFNIPSEIRRVLGADAQPIIDQLNKTGTIDPSTIPAGDLANLQNSPLLAPFIFFGGGLTLTGINTPPISGDLRMNRSFNTNLEHVMLRALDNEPATFRVGDRIPIVTSTFNAVAFSAQGSAALASTPQFQYQDLGLTLKTTPRYHSDGHITLKMELEIQGLGTLSINSIPDITTRSYQGSITVRDGEPSIIMGTISDQEVRSTHGLPLISRVPGLHDALASNSKQITRTELLIVVTPHIVRMPFHDKGTGDFWDTGQ